ADSHSVLNPKGLSLLVVMASCCYVGILTGFGAFILSFLGSRQANLFKIPTVLHFVTAFLYGGALVLCVYLFTQVKTKLLKKQFQAAQVWVLVGESFTMAVFAVFFSLASSVLSLLHPNIRNPRYIQITDEECATLINQQIREK
uniref:Uncharacterized protein n=1 Tax=Callorhinchus milii TaxID=7868 RepID=A0A4W3IEK4_CALMI